MRMFQLCAATAFTFLAASAAFGGQSASLVRMDGVGGLDIVQAHSSCHQNVRTHNGAYPQHTHKQSNCAVVIVGGGGGGGGGGNNDCHADVRKHWVAGYGSVWHRHQGNQCHVNLYEAPGGPTPGIGGCIQVGPLVVCQ